MKVLLPLVLCLPLASCDGVQSDDGGDDGDPEEGGCIPCPGDRTIEDPEGIQAAAECETIGGDLILQIAEGESVTSACSVASSQ